MENASKALLIAGGILLTMLIIGILLLSLRNISNYYKSKNELLEVEDTTKFNLQFANYEKREVYGYELVSLANKIVDYNFRYGNPEGAKNDKKYNAISMNISFIDQNGENRVSDLKHGTLNKNALFSKSIYTIDGISEFIGKTVDIENFYHGSDTATQLAKSIDALILSNYQFEANKDVGTDRIQSERIAVEKYNHIVKEKRYTDLTGKKINANGEEDLVSYLDMCKLLTASDSNVMKYYEYYQFKKSTFNCTQIKYDEATGKISNISFQFIKL